jgi:integrase
LKTSDPDFVSGQRGSYKIQPPIQHPAFCVCPRCSRLPAAERDRPHRFRIYRASPEPASRPGSAAYARKVQAEEEERLRSELAEAVRRGRTEQLTFAAICEAYRGHHRSEGKRLDRDRYVIATLEEHFGAATDPSAITKADYARMVADFTAAGRSASTISRYTNTLLAILNSGVRDGLIAGHQLTGVRRPKSRRRSRPVTFTARQVAILLGPAMDRYEAEQVAAVAGHDPETHRIAPSVLPLRGFCLIAYLTLMRPANNFGLRWEDVTLDPKRDTGSFRLPEHKNVTRGVDVEGPLHPVLVRYLRPRQQPRGFVHPNPATGRPYFRTGRPWARLVAIANDLLRQEGSEPLRGAQEHFYTWRHTGASQLAATGADPVMIVRLMGDTSLKTVMEHYFDSSLEHMSRIVAAWNPGVNDSVADSGKRTGKLKLLKAK